MKNFKLNRAVSFIIVTLVYAIAGVSSIFIYKAFNLPFWLTLLIADALATVIVFIYSVTLNNASVYDPYWSVQPIFILICYAVQYGLTLSGWIILVVVCLWGIRLTANWAYTFKNLTHQDWRYTMLKEQLIGVLDTLTPREEKVLRLRYGLDDGKPRTLEEVGKEFNVTRERIRQIEAKALRKLRHPSRSRKLKDYLE